jgi:hypothetical protein
VHGQRRRHAYGHGELQRKDLDGNNDEGNWQFNWQTLSSYGNSCRAVVVKFSDGTTSLASNFKFKSSIRAEAARASTLAALARAGHALLALPSRTEAEKQDAMPCRVSVPSASTFGHPTTGGR